MICLENESSNRRRFFNKLVGVAALGGIASLILGHEVERVHALDGSGAAGQITYWSDADSITGSDHLKWDNTNRNFIAGYSGNTVTSGVVGATISGGGESSSENLVTDDYGTVSGGKENQAGDDANTTSDKPYATVGGGYHNTANGQQSTVGGGADNIAAGDYSFAAGSKAKNSNADHDGTFLFSDASGFDFNSAAANEFAIRCTGGARFVTALDGSGNPLNGIYMASPAKLGVGTSAPVDMVHVVSPAGADANIRFEGSGNVTGFVLKNTGTGGRDWRIRVNKNTITPNGGLVFQDDSASPPTPRMVIDTSGNVGIGTTAPTQKLHVVGSVRATGGFITGDITYANGVKTTEEGDGLAFLNAKGEKIAVLDREGNWHIKGKVMEDL